MTEKDPDLPEAWANLGSTLGAALERPMLWIVHRIEAVANRLPSLPYLHERRPTSPQGSQEAGDPMTGHTERWTDDGVCSDCGETAPLGWAGTCWRCWDHWARYGRTWPLRFDSETEGSAR